MSIEIHNTLTNRELEILELLARGELVRNISSQLEISLKTVIKHKENIMRKCKAGKSINLVGIFYHHASDIKKISQKSFFA